MLINLMRMLSDGPAVSLSGSPTVSPMTAALCASEPLPSSSISFLALSHAPPLLDMNSASSTPQSVAPISMPASAARPRTMPTTTGEMTAIEPGRSMFLSAAPVAISTQRL